MRQERKVSWTMRMRTPGIRGVDAWNLVTGLALGLACALLATGCVSAVAHHAPNGRFISDLRAYLCSGESWRQRIDPSRVGLMGFSAGGLSSLLSADDNGPSRGSGNAAGDRNSGRRPMRLSLLHELDESKTFATWG